MRIVGYVAAIVGGATVWLLEVFVGVGVAGALLLGGTGGAPAPTPSAVATTATTGPCGTVACPAYTEATATATGHPSPRPAATTAGPEEPADEPQAAYYASCAEARREGAAPLVRGAPGYRPGLDRDGDGRACE